MKQITLSTVIFLMFVGSVASPRTVALPSEVLSWTAETRAAQAGIDVVRWLEGSWEGDLEGGKQQWTALAPVAGDMPGLGRGWGADGTVWFYEISLFTQVGDSIEFRVKHFSQQLAAWEGKDEYVRHRLIKVTEKALYFDDITFVKRGPDAHSVFLRLRDGERKGQIIAVHQSRAAAKH